VSRSGPQKKDRVKKGRSTEGEQSTEEKQFPAGHEKRKKTPTVKKLTRMLLFKSKIWRIRVSVCIDDYGRKTECFTKEL